MFRGLGIQPKNQKPCQYCGDLVDRGNTTKLATCFKCRKKRVNSYTHKPLVMP